MNAITAISLVKEIETSSKHLSILKGVSLSVKQGETIAILGSSGSGKTTLLSILAGLDTPTAGEIFFGDQNLSLLTEDERALLRLEKVGFIFQNFELLSHLTALENVMLPLELKEDKEARAKAVAMLTTIGLAERLQHFPRQLSGGEQQRVAIARVFAASPQVIFADEPTGNLDNSTAEQIIELLFEFNKAHKSTLIIVTHDEKLAKRCQQQFKLAEGHLELMHFTQESETT